MKEKLNDERTSTASRGRQPTWSSQLSHGAVDRKQNHSWERMPVWPN
jgi:hypothetical protein